MPGLIKFLLQGLVVKFVREKIKQGSLHGVRLYIGLVQQVRLVSMAALTVTATAAAVLIGFSFVLGGLIFLLPVSKAAIPYIFMGVGFAMVLLGSFSLRTFFKEEHWMEMSEAYTLMDKALALGDPDAKQGDPRARSQFANFAKHAGSKMREEAENKPFPQRPTATQRMETQEA